MMNKLIRIKLIVNLDSEEYPESKLSGSMKDIIRDHTIQFAQDILGDNTPLVEIEEVKS